MRYHTKRPKRYSHYYAETYICDHPLYSRCTLYRDGELGLAVIQQRYTQDKCTFWTEIDPWLVDRIYIQPKFKEFFYKYASKSTSGIFPGVTVRQIMWALRMKPLKKELWETAFDHKPI